MDINDSNAETLSKSTHHQGSNVSKSFIDNLYYKYKNNFTNYLIDNKDSIKLLVNNSTMKKINVVDYFNKLNSYENLTPIPHMIKKKYKSEKEKKEFSKIERDAVCLRRIEYSFINKQNYIIKKYNCKIKNIIKIQKYFRGFLFRKIMTKVNNLMKKIEKLLMHIKRFFLIRILKNMKNIKKNNTEKKINIIKNDQLDFKHCFSDLIKNYFNDEEEKKENQKLNKTKRKSVMVGTSEQILKNNLKSKVKEFNSNTKDEKIKLNNKNKIKKSIILEPYQNIINSMKKTQRKSCVINSFSFNNNTGEKRNSLKINIIENDKLDFKHCFSDLMESFFNDEEEKKGNKKPIHTKRKSVMVGTSEQILKNNLKSKVKEFNSNTKDEKIKLNNKNKIKKSIILEPYQNIINSMKKTQRKSCVINSFSFNNKKNEKKNSNNFQQYKRSKTVIKYYKPKIPFFLNQIKKKNKRKKTWNTNSISLLKTNPIQEVDSSFENNNQSISSINKSSFQNSNIENSKEKQLKNETIDLNFDMEIENLPNNFIINNENDVFDPKIILLILLLKKDITFKIKTSVFNLIKKYSRKNYSIENNFDTIQDNFNEINKDRFENISIIYKKAFKFIKKKNT